MGTGRSPKAEIFASWLRGQMAQRDLSNRALGRLIDPDNPEQGRRKVLRHLKAKHFPVAKSRAIYIEVFQLDGDPFTDEEEDSQPMAAELAYISKRLARLERVLSARERSLA